MKMGLPTGTNKPIMRSPHQPTPGEQRHRAANGLAATACPNCGSTDVARNPTHAAECGCTDNACTCKACAHAFVKG